VVNGGYDVETTGQALRKCAKTNSGAVPLTGVLRDRFRSSERLDTVSSFAAVLLESTMCRKLNVKFC
jgi:hypothetical protein